MPADTRPSTEEREEMAKDDDRPNDYIVLTRPTGAANGGYSYHEPDSEGKPLCNAGDEQAKYQEVTVYEAQRNNKSPCQMCKRIMRNR